MNKIKKIIEVAIAVLGAFLGAFFGSCSSETVNTAVGFNDSTVVYNSRVKVVNLEAICPFCSSSFLLDNSNCHSRPARP